MSATLTHEDFLLHGLTHPDTHTLFDWDSHGYEIAYYPATAYGTWDDMTGDGEKFTIDRLADGSPMIRDHDGDVLCGGCATRYLTENEDGVVTAAFQINGEVGDCEDVRCDNCGELIYEAPRGTGCPEVCEDES